MVNMRKYLILLLLTGCTPYIEHQPNVDSVKDEQKYSNDLDLCRHQIQDAQDTAGNFSQGVATIGLGYIGLFTARSADGTYSKIDDCLRAKGYNIN
jgi:hypothetical protein